MYKTMQFLMIEDNPGDIRLSQEYLKYFTGPISLNVVKDDAEALEHLRCQGEYDLAIQPDVVLISIRELWRKENRLLQQLKGDATLAHIPIVILTAFDGEESCLYDDLTDILCVSKPLNSAALSTIVSHIGGFGLTTVKTRRSPKHSGPGQSLCEVSHTLIYKCTQNAQAQLWNWENEGGRIGYVSE